MIMNEEFATFDEFTPIQGFEDYGVSRDGRIFSFKRKIELKQGMWGEYKRVCMSKNNIRHDFLVHRIVATAFIPNTECLPQVNHKDGNKLNNHVDNLEWCTCSYNVKHGYQIGVSTPPWKGKQRDELTREKLRTCHIGRKQGKDWIEKRIAPRRGVNHPLATKVAQYDLQGNFIRQYDMVKEAAEDNGLRVNVVSSCLRGRTKKGGGFIWKYVIL